MTIDPAVLYFNLQILFNRSVRRETTMHLIKNRYIETFMVFVLVSTLMTGIGSMVMPNPSPLFIKYLIVSSITLLSVSLSSILLGFLIGREVKLQQKLDKQMELSELDLI
jgi:hypothetical protein